MNQLQAGRDSVGLEAFLGRGQMLIVDGQGQRGLGQARVDLAGSAERAREDPTTGIVTIPNLG